MMEWTVSKVLTSLMVLAIAASFLGLYGMQAASVRRMELEDLADRFSDLVAEIDGLACEASVEVNWTGSMESHGLPRTFHGKPFVIQFTYERPYIIWDGERVSGRPFSSQIDLLGNHGEHVDLLEIPSTTGFIVSSKAMWAHWGLDFPISIAPICQR
jgi:hypothetical protein